jgi:hypothetical protein
MKHLTMAELEAGLEHIRQTPRDSGVLQLIVRRPRPGEREILEEGRLDPVEGLIGDTWRARGSNRTSDGSAHIGMQLTVMNARAIALLAQEKTRWPFAGDQLFLEMDLSLDNLPAGTQLDLGSAVIEVTDQPHTGCKKFVERFGLDAMKFVNSTVGRQLNLRGINTKVIQGGTVRVGDIARKR